MKTLETAYPIVQLCTAFDVSRSGYYRWRAPKPGRRVGEDARLKTQIQNLHAGSRGTYGRPRLLAGLRRGGERTSARRGSMSPTGGRFCPRRRWPSRRLRLGWPATGWPWG